MKKFILSVAMLSVISFAACSSDDSEGGTTCKTCDDFAGAAGVSLEICDNGDGTATFTTTVAGQSASETVDIPDGESLDSFPCDIDFDIL